MWIQIVRFIALVPLVGPPLAPVAEAPHGKARSGLALHRWMYPLRRSETNPNTNRSLATLTYVYFIEDYRFGTYTQQFKKKSDADDFVRELKDKHVPIRYNPSKPDESVLEDVDVRQLSSSLST